MTYFIGIGAKRIQAWIARTPKLSLMRGASIALHEYTAADVIDAQLENSTRVQRCPAAGDIDGVVAIQGPSASEAQHDAQLILEKLAAQLPAVEWEAWGVEESSYLTAYVTASRGGPGVWHAHAIPPLRSLGLIESCGMCRREHAISGAPRLPHDAGEREFSIGEDCRARHQAQSEYRRKIRNRDATMEEATDWIGWSAIPGSWPSDFEALATRGGQPGDGESRPQALGRKDSLSHVATVAADGNSIGGLFDALANSRLPLRGLPEEAVRELNRVTHEAVIAAARSVGSDDTDIKVALPHFVGGDDVLVSVPAWAAWTFAAELITGFEQLRVFLMQRLGDIPEDPHQEHAQLTDKISDVSLGVGLAFAHRSHPFAETQQIAHSALTAAKRMMQGQRSAIGWFDMTEDQSRANPWVIEAGQVWRELASDTPPDLFQLSPSARARLSKVLRDSSPATRAAEVERWNQRTNSKLTTPVDQMAALLSRARWWPRANDQEDTTTELPR